MNTQNQMECKRKECNGHLDTERHISVLRGSRFGVIAHACENCRCLHYRSDGKIVTQRITKKETFFIFGRLCYQ